MPFNKKLNELKPLSVKETRAFALLVTPIITPLLDDARAVLEKQLAAKNAAELARTKLDVAKVQYRTALSVGEAEQLAVASKALEDAAQAFADTEKQIVFAGHDMIRETTELVFGTHYESIRKILCNAYGLTPEAVDEKPYDDVQRMVVEIAGSKLYMSFFPQLAQLALLMQLDTLQM